MRPLDQETNIEVLREYTKWLQAQVRDLSLELTELHNRQESAKQEWLEKTLRDQFSRLQKKFYGFGRESISSRKDRPVGHEGEQLRLHGEHRLAEGVASQKSSDPLEAAVYEFKRKSSAKRVLFEGSVQ